MKHLIFLALLLILSSAVIAEQTSTADLNGDGTVDLGDFSILALRWLAVSNCDGKQCGDDGCGGSCGICTGGDICDSNGSCIPLCDHVGFESLGEQNSIYVSGSQFLHYQADSNIAAPLDSLTFEIYQNLGGPTALGTYPIPDTDYSTTELAVLINNDCGGGCYKTFLANSGTMVITSIGTTGGQFTGSLSNVELVEVTIDPSTYVSTPVPDGEDWCILEYAFDTVIN